MPWKESTLMSQRREFVHLAMTEEIKMRGLCRRFGISAKTGYKWLHLGIEKKERRGCRIVLDALTPVLIEPHTAKNKMF
jgi:transposase-like protein